MKNSHQVLIGIVGIVLVAQGCAPANQATSSPTEAPSTLSPGSDADQPSQLTAPTILETSPEAAAEALMDPKRVEEGVWFLLRGLGIGVYTGDGQQILPGSETGPTDFWIYDFEFPLIVRLAMAESSPFSEFQKQLDGLGWSSSQDETLTLYKGVYDGNSTAYLPRLHAAMGLRFEGDPEVTPLQEWLLLLDTFLPPNGSASIGRGRSIWMSFPGMGLLANARLGPVLSTGVSARPAQPAPCGWIQGGTFHANWGLVNAGSSAVDLLAADTAYYAIHGPLLARSIGAELKTSEPNVHEGHGAPGETVTFDVAMDIDYRIGGIIPIGSPTCGYLINLDPPLGSGELPPAHIWWRLGPQFKHHGSFRDVRNHVFDGSRPTETDPSGRTAITFEAREEPANGQGELMSVDQKVRASFDPREWIAAMGLTEPRLLALLPATIDISPSITIDLEWHEIASYKLEFDSLFVTNTFTPSGTGGPIQVTQHVRAVVPLEWSPEDQAYFGEAPLEYVLFDVPPIIGLGGDGGVFDPCPNTTSATGGTFQVLRLAGVRDPAASQSGQAPWSSLEVILDPGTTVESIVPVCPPPAAVPPGFSFPMLTWSQLFASAHNRETQVQDGPYTITDWVIGSGSSVAVKSYSSSSSAAGILTTTEETTITLMRK